MTCCPKAARSRLRFHMVRRERLKVKSTHAGARIEYVWSPVGLTQTVYPSGRVVELASIHLYCTMSETPTGASPPARAQEGLDGPSPAPVPGRSLFGRTCLLAHPTDFIAPYQKSVEKAAPRRKWGIERTRPSSGMASITAAKKMPIERALRISEGRVIQSGSLMEFSILGCRTAAGVA